MRLAWCSLTCLLLVPPSCLGEVQHISIVLRPRHYVNPRNRTDFLCGLQPELDAGRLLAELSSPYILQLLDNTEDPDTRYRTTVQDIAFLTPTGVIHMTPSPCNASCHALFALVLVPPTGTCYTGLFSDAEILGKDHIVLYIGASLPDDVLAKYRDQADKLTGLYGGEMPRLCVIQSPMEASVAESRVASLAALFNFPFEGGDRRLANQDLRCTTATETEESLAFSGIFDYEPAGVTFEKENDTILEDTGRCETNISRSTTGKVGVAFVETTLDTATKSDLVPYNGPVAFSSGASSASFLVQVKIDDVQEEDETFSFTLKKVTKRSKRTKQAEQTTQKTISDKKPSDGQPRPLPLERACLLERALQLQVTKSFLDGEALTDYTHYIAARWTVGTSPFQIPKEETFETKCADYEANKIDLFTGIFKTKREDYPAYIKNLQKETFLETKSQEFGENSKMFLKEKKEFEEKFFPCLLQDILINRPELGKRWTTSEIPDLFRLTTEEKLMKNFGIKIKGDNWNTFVNRIHKTKNFLSFAMKEDENTYLTDDHHFAVREIGLEVLGTDRTIQQKGKCSARSIKQFNPNPNGEREAIFPVGTRFSILSYKDMGQQQFGFPRHVFRLLEM